MSTKFTLGRGGLTAEDKREIAQRQERITKDADPQVLRRTARWEDHHRLPPRKGTELPPPLPMALRPQPTHFDRVSDWYCGYLGVRQEYELSYEDQQDLKQCVPQSILRDIFRPVKTPQFEWERPDFELDPGGRKALAEAKKMLQRDPLPTLVPATEVFAAARQRRQRLHNHPWLPRRPDSAPRYYSEQDHIHYNEVEVSS